MILVLVCRCGKILDSKGYKEDQTPLSSFIKKIIEKEEKKIKKGEESEEKIFYVHFSLKKTCPECKEKQQATIPGYCSSENNLLQAQPHADS
jgi:hypothetical protein